jgi:hypothetical protein
MSATKISRVHFLDLELNTNELQHTNAQMNVHMIICVCNIHMYILSKPFSLLGTYVCST